MSIILGVYPVIQLLTLSSLMVMEANLTIHAITIAMSTAAYFVVAFKNPGYFEGEKDNPPSIDDQIRRESLVNDQRVIKELDQQDDGCDKSQLQNNGIENENEIIPQQLLPNQTQNNNSPSQLNQNIEQKLQQKLIKSKLPTSSPQHIQKLTQLKTNQIDFMLKQSSKQIHHRYCRICKTFQPNRVRHCNQCQKCICTFDHHCPWMNNCIGEKNRNLFWVYLLLQFVEFLLVLIDVGGKAMEVRMEKERVYFFVGSVLIVTIVAFMLLVFHTYLMLKNFTTWEYVRWDRINYLSIYIYKKSSPFSYGFVRNLTDYFVPDKVPKQWTINAEFLKKNKQLQDKIKQGRSEKSIPQIPKLKSKVSQRAQTQRAIISRNVS